MILRVDSEKFKYLSKNLTNIENTLTHWSVAQAGRNDEKKTGGRKSFWTVPLKVSKMKNLRKTGTTVMLRVWLRV